MKIKKLLGLSAMALLMSLLAVPMQAQDKKPEVKKADSKVKMQKQNAELDQKATELQSIEPATTNETKEAASQERKELKQKETKVRVGDDASDADPSEGKGKKKNDEEIIKEKGQDKGGKGHGKSKANATKQAEQKAASGGQ
jgi:hypothetical protein